MSQVQPCQWNGPHILCFVDIYMPCYCMRWISFPYLCTHCSDKTSTPLCKRLIKLVTKTLSKLCIIGHLWCDTTDDRRMPNHKKPVMRTAFSYHDVLILHLLEDIKHLPRPCFLLEKWHDFIHDGFDKWCHLVEGTKTPSAPLYKSTSPKLYHEPAANKETTGCWPL